MKHAIHHIHFVGIGGVGMSGIAELLLRLGYRVSGSDQSDSDAVQRLMALGACIHIGHAAENVTPETQVVVVTSAVNEANPEVKAARQLGIPVVPRAAMLAELLRTRDGIAIAGTHGKTTTTSLVASIVLQAGLDPTFAIGGQLHSAGTNARLGAGSWMVVEADESDASFLQLPFIMAVVTNIDADHMVTYGQDFERLKAAFAQFLNKMPFYGTAIVCTEDAPVRSMVEQITLPKKSIIGYGFHEGAQVRAVNVRAVGGQMHFTVQRPQHEGMEVVLNLVGRHNVLNALAAITVAMQLEIADAVVLAALRDFQGVGRRFQRWGDHPTITVIDDYGHHPTELQAVLEAARGAFPNRRLVLAFEPHRYTRTRDCFADLITTFAQFDAVLLSEVYAASEAPIAGATGHDLANALHHVNTLNQNHHPALLVGDISAMPQAIVDFAQAGDVVLCMGAGCMADVPAQVVRLLQGNAS